MSRILSEMEIDIIRELMNLGVNNSTNILSEILNAEIDLKVPHIKFCKIEELMDELKSFGSDDLTAVNMEYKGKFSGVSQLVFSQDSANKIVEIFSKQLYEDENLDENKSGAMIEIGNIVLNAVMAEFSNFFNDEFEFFIPNFFENYENDFYTHIDKYSDDVILMGKTIFVINEYNIQGDIVIFMKIDSFNNFIALVDNCINQL